MAIRLAIVVENDPGFQTGEVMWQREKSYLFFSLTRGDQHRLPIPELTMSTSGLKAIAPVPTAADFLDIVLSKTQRKTPTVRPSIINPFDVHFFTFFFCFCFFFFFLLRSSIKTSKSVVSGISTCEK